MIRCHERAWYTTATGEKAENHCGHCVRIDGTDCCSQGGRLGSYAGSCASSRKPKEGEWKQENALSGR